MASNHEHPFAAVARAFVFQCSSVPENLKVIRERTVRITKLFNGLQDRARSVLIQPRIQLGTLVDDLFSKLR